MKLIHTKFASVCAAPACIHATRKLAAGDPAYWHKDNSGSRVWHPECVDAMKAGTQPSNLPSGVAVPQAMPAGGVPASNGPQPVALNKSRSNCLICPNLVAPADTSQFFKAPVGSYMCKARGIVVASPNATTEELEEQGEMIGKSCSDFGNDAATLPDHMESRVGQYMGPHTTDPAHLRAASCTQCKHYATPDVVSSELGWGVGMCTVQGRLILPTAIMNEALNCGDWSAAGKPAGDVTQVRLLPRFKSMTGRANVMPTNGTMPAQPVTPPDPAKLRDKHRVDPRMYETDKEVTDSDRAAHIRAWRKVEDPEGYGKPIYMPIFDGCAIMAAENAAHGMLGAETDPRATVASYQPELYVDHEGLLYQVAAVMLRHDYVPLAEGPSGSGKTAFFAWMAYLMDIPFIRIAIDAGTEVYHLSGEKELVVDEASGQAVTSYKLGRFSAWYSRTAMICVDEANLKADVWQFLRPTADGGKRIDLDDGQGISISRGPRTFLALTQNPAWDPLYIGTEPVSAADLQRVAPIWFDYPTGKIEGDIIVDHCAADGYDIPTKIVDQILQISSDIRGMKQSVPIPWGVRSNVKVAKFSESFRLPLAYRRAILDGQESSVADLIMQSVNTVVK